MINTFMRTAAIIGLTATVYITLQESEFLNDHPSQYIKKTKLSEEDQVTIENLVRKDVYKRHLKNNQIVYKRNLAKDISNLKLDPIHESKQIIVESNLINDHADPRTQALIAKYAYMYDIPYNVAYGIAFVESRFKHKSDDGITTGDQGRSTGIFQIQKAALQDVINAGLMPDNANLNNLEHNIAAGLSYLALMRQKAGGNLNTAIRMYNGGPNARNKPNEAKDYLNRVQKASKQINLEIKQDKGAPIKYFDSQNRINLKQYSWENKSDNIVSFGRQFGAITINNISNRLGDPSNVKEYPNGEQEYEFDGIGNMRKVVVTFDKNGNFKEGLSYDNKNETMGYDVNSFQKTFANYNPNQDQSAEAPKQHPLFKRGKTDTASKKSKSGGGFIRSASADSELPAEEALQDLEDTVKSNKKEQNVQSKPEMTSNIGKATEKSDAALANLKNKVNPPLKSKKIPDDSPMKKVDVTDKNKPVFKRGKDGGLSSELFTKDKLGKKIPYKHQNRKLHNKQSTSDGYDMRRGDAQEPKGTKMKSANQGRKNDPANDPNR